MPKQIIEQYKRIADSLEEAMANLLTAKGRMVTGAVYDPELEKRITRLISYVQDVLADVEEGGK